MTFVPLLKDFEDLGAPWPNWEKYLDGRPTLLPKLEHLELRIPTIGWEESELENPRHFIWRMMEINLRPDRLPHLKDVTLKCTWLEMEGENPKRYESDQRDAVLKLLEERVPLCLPTWDGDTRGITFYCSFDMTMDW